MSVPRLRSYRLAAALLGTTILAAQAAPAAADNRAWNGSQSNDWNDPANWSPAGAPTANDQAQIDTQSPNAPVIGPGDATVYQLFVANQGTIANLTINGSLTSSMAPGAFYDQIGSSHSDGTVTVAGDQARWNSGHAYFGFGGGGVGTLNVMDHAEAQIGAFGLGVAGSTGSLFVTDAAIVTADTVLGDPMLTPDPNDSGIGNAQLTRSVWGTDTFDLSHGTVTLTDNSILTSGVAGGTDRIGRASGTVSISSSAWSSAADRLLIGEGVGSLMVDAGRVDAGAVSVGPGGTGSVTLKNAGVMDVATIAVGATVTENGTARGGTGSVYLTSGATLKSGLAFVEGAAPDSIGSGAGATGLVSIDAARWSSGNALTIGRNGGTGTLGVSNAGSYQTTGLLAVGDGGASTGYLTLSGGSVLRADGSLTIGNQGGSGLAQLDNASAARIGGGVSVGGNLFADVAGQTYVVTTGSGLLNILGGSTVVTNAVSPADISAIGIGTGSQGTVAVDGAGSALHLGGITYVGAAGGGGVIRASGGGAILADKALTIGGVDSVTGGGGTTFGGIGLNGGTLQTQDTVLIGDNGAHGTVSIGAGGSWTGSGAVAVGNDGGIGRVTLDGAGAHWTQSGAVAVGATGGDGGVALTAGAQARVVGALDLGKAATGVVELDGAGTALTVSGGGLTAGTAGGRGYLGVTDHAVLTSDGDFTLGFGAGSTGTLVVAGGARATLGAHVSLGAEGGVATLTVQDGALVESGGDAALMTVGSTAASRAQIGVSGGGVLNTHSDVTFGGDGTGATVAAIAGAGSQWAVLDGRLDVTGGRIDVSDGGRLFTGGGAGVGGNGANPATIVVSGAGSQWSTFADTYIGGTLGVGGAVTPGTGLVAVRDGGAISAGRLALASAGGTGTLTIDHASTVAAGDYRQGAGGTLLIGIDPNANGVSGRLTTDGTITLADGTHIGFVREAAGRYTIGDRYEVLLSRGGPISRGAIRFDGLEQQSLFVGLVPTFGAVAGAPLGEALYLDVAQTRSFASVAATPNQAAAATGADSLGNTAAVKAAILDLQTEDQARGAFDSLSGEIHPGVRTALIEDARLPRQAVLGRLADAEARAGGWLQGIGTWGSTGGDGNAAMQSRQTKGVLIGLDLPIAETGLRAGLAGGYGDGDLSVGARASHADLTSYHALGYVGGSVGHVQLRVGGGYSWSKVDTRRSVAFPGFTDSLHARYDARTLQGFGEIGYRLPLGTGWVEPFAGVSAVRVSSDGFTEAGGAAALTVAHASATSTASTLGIKGSAAVAGPVIATVNLGWQHRFGDLTPSDTMRFAGGSAFSIAGVPLAKDAAVAELSVGWRLRPGTTLSAGYSGAIGAKTHDTAVKATLALAF